MALGSVPGPKGPRSRLIFSFLMPLLAFETAPASVFADGGGISFALARDPDFVRDWEGIRV